MENTMAARANLVINDRTTPTPVAHTYTPDGDDLNGVHIFSEKGAVPAGNPQYTIALRKSGGRYRASIKLRVPVVQTQVINGVSNPVEVRYAEVNLQTSFDALSTEQERADAIGLMVNSLAPAQTQINDLVVKLSDIY
jgi:hypothetical protein